MRHKSLYLDWYIHVPNVKYDFRSSGINHFQHNLGLKVDLSINYEHGNPDASKYLARRYGVEPENVFISSEGASGQNARIIRCIAERDTSKNEAVVEYPTYEPMLRQAQEHFKSVKRFERCRKDSYRLDADAIRKAVSKRTGVLIITNPHAPSGAVCDANESKAVTNIAHEYGFYVLCDEIYAEFDRKNVPTLFSIDSELGIVTTSFTKAFGLGGLKLGIAVAHQQLVDELYSDVLNTVGNSPNIVQTIALGLLAKNMEDLERHKCKWNSLRSETEKWLNENGIDFFPNKMGVTYWTELPVSDTYRWVNEYAVPRHSLAVVPGTFFLFRTAYQLEKSNMVRLGLGNLTPSKITLLEALEVLKKALTDSED
jgi:aspartate/methionine/tyrosine aminotransferase